jgi:exodeoxyribonuclease-3
MPVRILSWNVNGLRAVLRKGFLDWLRRESPDALCLQETKTQPDQLPEDVLEPEGYHAYWSWGDRRGYSGVGLYTRQEPVKVETSFGVERLDAEGRVIMARYPGFTLFSTYFPNGKSGQDRLDYKLAFYDDFLKFADGLTKQGHKLVVCGDFNTAHHEIDLARPKENAKMSGFLPIERAWMDRFEEHGFVDTFRHFNKEPGHYSWWDLKTRARERNVGWRIDYFYVSSDLLPAVRRAFILPDVTGSDHCPVGIELEV